jgi:hypothetical protein
MTSMPFLCVASLDDDYPCFFKLYNRKTRRMNQAEEDGPSSDRGWQHKEISAADWWFH